MVFFEQRNLERTLRRAIRTASRQRIEAKSRLLRMQSYCSTLEEQGQLPLKYVEMYQTLSSLPLLELSPSINTTEAGKRQWETNKTGYMNWALGQLMVKGMVAQVDGLPAVDKLDATVTEVGTGEALRLALNTVDVVKRQLDVVEGNYMTERSKD